MFQNLIGRLFGQSPTSTNAAAAGVTNPSIPSEEAKKIAHRFDPDLRRLSELERQSRFEAAERRRQETGSFAVVSGIGLPSHNRMSYPGYQAEKDGLTAAANIWHEAVKPTVDDYLIAHGTGSAGQFCQILLDGVTRHAAQHESYGSLIAGNSSIQTGGYWDNGWGVFVLSRRAFMNSGQHKDGLITIPLEAFRAIVIPEGIVFTARLIFPKWEHKLRSHKELAHELTQEAQAHLNLR